MKISGRYGIADVYASSVDGKSISQISELMDQSFVSGEHVAIMPDVHAGKGCVIGYTQTINNMRVCPNLVGVDIGCGMLTVELGNIDLDFEKLDKVIRKSVPHGTNVHMQPVSEASYLEKLHCFSELEDRERLYRSLGSLGGGNHFIEIDEDSEGNKYLVIHSGSRNLGTQVASLYQDYADMACNPERMPLIMELKQLINICRKEGREKDIRSGVKTLQEKYSDVFISIPPELAYLDGDQLENYLDDADICARFADDNRVTMASLILGNYDHLKLDDFPHFTTRHNYIDLSDKVLRKGSISARKGEVVLIPMNMRDGSLICRGRGNPEYNFSAPHGAGRKLSRTDARASLSIEEFRNEMDGIYTTSVSKKTLDESPMAYKSMDDILPSISSTVDIIRHIKPIYNFKAAE